MKRRKRKQQRRSSSFTPASSFDRPQFKKVRALDAMAAFPNLNSDAGLKKLDEHLLTRYYITSHKASKDDITIYAALSKSPPSKYVNASRWYDHIETLLSISGISSEGSGVTIDGSASITEEADGNSKDGVVVIDDDDNDQDVDLIGEEAEERPASLIASTKKKISWESIVIVVMPEDDETDMNKLEEQVRSIQMEGLVWGASKVVSVGYGVKLLRIIGTVPLDEEIYVFDGIVETHIMSFGRVNVATSGLYESLILIQPNEDEADMKKLEETVRSIHVAGLFWGASKLVPVGCGIKLLGIECTTVGHLVHLRRIVTLNTFVKEKIADNPYVKSCQTLCLNRIFNGIKEEESDSKMNHRIYFAAWNTQSKRAGLAWIFTDSTGLRINQGTTTKDQISSPLIAEALALRSALLSAETLGFRKLRCFSDNSTLIRAINTDLQIKEIYGIIKDIKTISSAFVGITFSFFSRSMNVEADGLAKQYLSSSLYLDPFMG
ncbi:unnamed protein product [Brassica rapa subsp. trilocularis]